MTAICRENSRFQDACPRFPPCPTFSCRGSCLSAQGVPPPEYFKKTWAVRMIGPLSAAAAWCRSQEWPAKQVRELLTFGAVDGRGVGKHVQWAGPCGSRSLDRAPAGRLHWWARHRSSNAQVIYAGTCEVPIIRRILESGQLSSTSPTDGRRELERISACGGSRTDQPHSS